MKKLTVLVAALLLAAGSVASAAQPLWLRHNCVSPDGKKVAFCYQGDIYTVSIDGGEAKRITSNPAYDSDPLWTDDSREIIFSSFREGSKDIFRISAEGGSPVRVTSHPASETPFAILTDGSIVYAANIQQDASWGGFPGSVQLYKIQKDGGRPELVTSIPMGGLSINTKGSIIYQDIKGYEDNFRKHHTSSVTRDIWLYTPEKPLSKKELPEFGNFTINSKGKFQKLTAFKGEDLNPVFASDGDKFYYLSEENGTFNIYRSSISAPGQTSRITSVKGNPIRYLSIADNGTLVYSYDGELYRIKNDGSPAKIEISLNTDTNERSNINLTLSRGARSLSVSPSGNEVAFIARGDVFVTSVDYNTTKRITNTAEQERDVCFSTDGRTLYYSSERNGHWGIYSTTLTDKNDKYFTYSVKMKEELVSKEGETCFQPQVSPDGKKIAYLRNRTEIVVKNIDGGKAKSILPGNINYSYVDGDQSFAWSPDSKYILCNYQANGGWNNEDVAVIDIAKGKIVDLTESGYTDSNFKWVLKGNAMAWQSDKDGYRSHGSWGAQNDIYLMFFNNDAYKDFLKDKEDKEIDKMLEEAKSSKKEEKKDTTASQAKKEECLELDFEGRRDRTFRLTGISGIISDFHLTQDGKSLYYMLLLENGMDLCVMDLEDGSVRVVEKGVSGSLYPTKDDKYIYLLSGSGISRIATANGQRKRISFAGEFEYKPAQEREYIFWHVWKQVSEKFYDPQIHGIDWEGYGKTYSKFLPHIKNNFDFEELLSEMLGELNASHTGARYFHISGMSFGRLGVLFDYEYKGKGLKIKEVLKGGALEMSVPEIEEGDIILAVNGVEINAGEDWYSHFTNRAGKKTVLTIKMKDGKKDIYLEPDYADNNLLYKRWVHQREEMVEKLSGGKIAYVHVAGMDSKSFREVYSRLLGKYRTCDAVIVDTRHNGGGWLHDDLVTLLSGKAYLKFEPRGQYISTEPYSKWTKPSCVLIDESNYSDASGFPYIYKTLGIGKLIGAPVPGTMTAVWWENQIDPTLVFGIPQVGAVGLKEGRYLENLQVEPDILVYNDPASMIDGRDLQLEAAVKEMMRQTGNTAE